MQENPKYTRENNGLLILERIPQTVKIKKWDTVDKEIEEAVEEWHAVQSFMMWLSKKK